jgi:hypothetical protein
MGYLNKETVTVDAILTRKGRELLALGRSAFQITQFAVADDEIDYGLYDPAHPLGTEYYGSAIENMPIVEASPDETQNLRYKLVSLSSGLNVVPRISLGGIDALSFDAGLGGSTVISPVTKVGSRTSELDGPEFGYTLTLYNLNALSISATPIIGQVTTQIIDESSTTTGTTQPGLRTGQVRRGISNTTTTTTTSTSGTSTTVTLIGTGFTIVPRDVDTIVETQLTITGNQSGATITIPVTVIPSTE